MVPVNYLAVLLAAVAAMVLGFLWFGPLFGKKWMEYIGMTTADTEAAKANPSRMYLGYGLQAVGALLMSYILAHTIIFGSAYTGATGTAAGISAALWSWLGFVVPATLGSVLWEKRPWGYWFLTSGYYLVSLVVMGIILSMWA